MNFNDTTEDIEEISLDVDIGLVELDRNETYSVKDIPSLITAASQANSIISKHISMNPEYQQEMNVWDTSSVDRISIDPPHQQQRTAKDDESIDSIKKLKKKMEWLHGFIEGKVMKNLDIEVSQDPKEFQSIRAKHHKISTIMDEFDQLYTSVSLMDRISLKRMYERHLDEILKSERDKMRKEFDIKSCHTQCDKKIQELKRQVYDCAQMTNDMDSRIKTLNNEVEELKLYKSMTGGEMDTLMKTLAKTKIKYKLLSARVTGVDPDNISIDSESDECITRADSEKVNKIPNNQKPTWKVASKILDSKAPMSVFYPVSDRKRAPSTVTSCRKYDSATPTVVPRGSQHQETVGKEEKAENTLKKALHSYIKLIDPAHHVEPLAQQLLYAIQHAKNPGIDEKEAKLRPQDIQSTGFRTASIPKGSFFLTQEANIVHRHRPVSAKRINIPIRKHFQ